MIETKHPQKKQTFKIAMLYSNGSEKKLQDFFAHREADVSAAYVDFLDLLGEKINLKGWKNYRGDIGAEIGKIHSIHSILIWMVIYFNFWNEIEQDSYYTKWKNIEVMFHISHWMIPEQHRRLLGILFFSHLALPSFPFPLSLLTG